MSVLASKGFRCIGPIGEGSSASVFECEASATSRDSFQWHRLRGRPPARVAIKMIPRDLTVDCVAERRALSILPEDKGVMRYYGVIEDEEFCYMVMELGSVGDLYKITNMLGAGKLSDKVSRFRAILHNLTGGLKKLHDRRLQHKDIKTKNIICRSFTPFDCFIADFGTMHQKGVDSTPTTIETTPDYTAPEQIRGKLEEEKSDVWSLAVAVVSASRGKEPFPQNTKKSIIFARILSGYLHQKLQDSFLFEIPAAKDLLLGMLEPDPNLRFSAKEAFEHPFTQGGEFVRPLRRVSGSAPGKISFSVSSMAPRKDQPTSITPIKKVNQAIPAATSSTQAQNMRTSSNILTHPSARVIKDNDSGTPQNARPSSSDTQGVDKHKKDTKVKIIKPTGDGTKAKETSKQGKRKRSKSRDPTGKPTT